MTLLNWIGNATSQRSNVGSTRVSGIHKTLIECDPIRDAAVHAAIDAQLARLKQQTGNDNTTIPFGSLHVDALVAADISRSAWAGTDPRNQRVDRSAQRLPRTTPRHDQRNLRRRRPTGHHGAAPVLRRNIHAILLDDNGEALNVGRERRTATRAQRRALRAMQRTCAHPHCTVSFDNCRIHHIVWWRNLGQTDIDNMLALCEQHHHLVHEGRWTLTMTAGRIATWTRPDGTHWHTGPTTNRTHHTNRQSGIAATEAAGQTSPATKPSTTPRTGNAPSATAPTGKEPSRKAPPQRIHPEPVHPDNPLLERRHQRTRHPTRPRPNGNWQRDHDNPASASRMRKSDLFDRSTIDLPGTSHHQIDRYQRSSAPCSSSSALVRRCVGRRWEGRSGENMRAQSRASSAVPTGVPVGR